MASTRLERKAKARIRRRNAQRLGLSAVVIVALAVVGTVAVRSRASSPPKANTLEARVSAAPQTPTEAPAIRSDVAVTAVAVDRVPADDFLAYSPALTSQSQTPVEVPAVQGRTVKDARALLEAAGLIPRWEPAASQDTASVTSQQPAAGYIAAAGSEVVLGTDVPAPTTQAQSAPQPVVCIDPGHQSHANLAKEPVGPGSKTLKAKVTGGATGIKTRVPEYEIALEIAMNVRARLRRAGVKVVMTRDDQRRQPLQLPARQDREQSRCRALPPHPRERKHGYARRGCEHAVSGGDQMDQVDKRA